MTSKLRASGRQHARHTARHRPPAAISCRAAQITGGFSGPMGGFAPATRQIPRKKALAQLLLYVSGKEH